MDKILGLLEEHIEKIIVAIVGLVCIWLLVTRVVLCPNEVPYEGRPFSPGAIDDEIGKQVRDLEAKLNRPPEPLGAYKPVLPDYIAKVDLSISGVDFSSRFPVSEPSVASGGGVGEYNLPLIGGVEDVAVEHIRAVVYVPTGEVTSENIYEGSMKYEPNDLDFVTVQGTFDIGELYKGFGESFSGGNVPLELRDPCLARPVFAAVHVERQELNDASGWSDWVMVPRTRIDYYKNLFEIIERIGDLPPGGVKVRMLNYKAREVQIGLIQPDAYRIATATEEWFPPVLHREFKEVMEAELLEERRRKREEEKQQNDQGSGQDDRRRRTSTGSRRSGAYGGVTGGVTSLSYGGSSRDTRRRSRSRSPDDGTYGDRGRTPRRRSRGETGDGDEYYATEEYATRGERSMKVTVGDIYNKLEELWITEKTDLRRLGELVFWAHDDSVEAGKTYRYRIRLGVFNPVAGKARLSKRDAALKNAVILWSNFSEVTEAVEIPQRLYFFAKSIQSAAKIVTVQVSKLELGYWYSEDFAVKSGEVIGGVVELERERPKASASTSRVYAPRRALGGGYSASLDERVEPEVINYNTGAVLVDVMAVSDWERSGKNMSARGYYDMLYSFDGMNIEHMPIENKYWPAELYVAYNEIRSLQREPREPFRSWSSTEMVGRPGAYDRWSGDMDDDEY